MSTPPAPTPTSANAGPSPAGDPKVRAVSSSFKDRIAKFNNPSAAPLIPTHAFGTAGPASAGSGVGPNSRGGLVGNRLPTLDPKTAGVLGVGRKVSENKGLIGNRIPSMGSGGNKARSASPAGSVDSSTASHRAGSGSTMTSRSSSPPTSPGAGQPGDLPEGSGLPASLLAATLPEDGGPGAMTPSSTRAEAGESMSQFSAPSTPVQAPTEPTTAGHYDLNLPNLKLAGENSHMNAAQMMLRGVPSSVTGRQSLNSSRMSQYDPSSGSGDAENMLQDVSGISTPIGTPRAAHKDLEGSVRGEGSARGEGSVVGEGDMDDLGQRLEGLNVEAPDRDPTPEPPPKEEARVKDEGGDTIDRGQLDITGPSGDADPNQAEDLDALKAGDLNTDKDMTIHPEPNMVNDMVQTGLLQNFAGHDIPPEEQREQGGVAGTRLEDIERATEIQIPDEVGRRPNPVTESSESDDQAGDDNGDHTSGKDESVDVRTATDQGSSTGSALKGQVEETESTAKPGEEQDESLNIRSTAAPEAKNSGNMPDFIQGKYAAGVKLSEAGLGPATSGEIEQLREAILQKKLDVVERPKTETDQVTKEELQTEEDRDEGMDRREQLVRALDQNKNVDSTLQDEVSGERRAEARRVTEGITGATATGGADMDIAKGCESNERQSDLEGDHQKKTGVRVESEKHDSGQKGEDTEGRRDEDDAGKDANHGPGSRADAKVENLITRSEEPILDRVDTKPLQVRIEPAPIAQPDDRREESASEFPIQPSRTPVPPNFPDPPTEDPDTFAPVLPVSGSSTPVDPSFIKSFPDVPDEAKPRVEVHVSSSPHNTPQKTPHSATTPLAKLPGHSKSLSNPDFGNVTPKDERRDSLEAEKTPTGVSRLVKRASSRRSPKSPLLDDEDPGDFEPGEGWAIVTKGRDT